MVDPPPPVGAVDPPPHPGNTGTRGEDEHEVIAEPRLQFDKCTNSALLSVTAKETPDKKHPQIPTSTKS